MRQENEGRDKKEEHVLARGTNTKASYEDESVLRQSAGACVKRPSVVSSFSDRVNSSQDVLQENYVFA